jgi:hypothetical protein
MPCQPFDTTIQESCQVTNYYYSMTCKRAGGGLMQVAEAQGFICSDLSAYTGKADHFAQSYQPKWIA